MRRQAALPWALLLSIFAATCDVVEGSSEYAQAITFFGVDAKYQPGFEHFDFVNPHAPKGGVLILPTPTGFDTLAPLWGMQTPPMGLEWTYDTLVTPRYGEMGTFYGRLAEGIRIAADRRSLALRIHPHARWHDGTPILADDVRFTVNAYSDSALGQLLAWIDAVEIRGEREIAFRLREDLKLRNILVLSWLPIMPAHYWRDRDVGKPTMAPPLGSGPYRIVAADGGRFVHYARVADYWGRDLPVNRGFHNFDEIRVDVYRDATVAREAFRKGLFDVWIEPDTRHWATGYDFPARERGEIGMKEFLPGDADQAGINRAVVFNQRLPRFRDQQVRRALSLAMDFDWLSRVLLFGLHERAESYFAGIPRMQARGNPQGAELALLETFREQLPVEVFSRDLPLANGWELRDRLVKARSLLREAGWVVRDGKLVDDRGEQFRLQFLAASLEDQRILLPYLANLETLGISGDLRVVDAAPYANLRRDYDYDALLIDIDFPVPPAAFLRGSFHSTATAPGNPAGIDDPIVDALIGLAEASRTLPEMSAAVRALDRVLLQGSHMILLDANEPVRLVYWNRFGLPDWQAMVLFPSAWWYEP